jgi:hypothetical protein
MDWLKKYYEKILLAGALLLLIVVATGLVFKIKSIETNLRLPEQGNKTVITVDLTPYSNAVAALKTPPQWSSPNAAALFPPVPVKAATNKVVEIEPPKGPIITLDSIVRRPFTLQFKAYIWDDKAKEGRNFQVNFITENRSFFVEKAGVEIADRHGKTGYTITKFDHKIAMVEVPGINSKMEQDTSELTVKHEGEDPIVLILGKVATYPKRYARIQCPEKLIEAGKGDVFETGDKTYKVIDITDKEVIILDNKSGEKQTLTPGMVVPREPDATRRGVKDWRLE